jgi:hypothetical protein
MVLSHPDLELLILRNIATQLHLGNTILFQLLVIIGNKKHLDDFINETLNLSIQEESKDFSEHCHALMLDGMVGLHRMLSQPEPTKASEAGFYSKTPKQEKEGTDQTDQQFLLM